MKAAAKKQTIQHEAGRHEISHGLLLKGYPLIWFAIAAFLIYGQSITFSYSYLDDHTLIMEHMEMLKLPQSMVSAFGDDVFHTPGGKGYYYRPVLTLSFVADAIIGQGNFSMFHLSNILYHIVATFLLFLVLIKVGFSRPGSFLFSLLFLVHPLNAQAVAWVPGRNDTLLAVFIFASFLSWLKYMDKKSSLYLLLHLLCFSLALLTKETAIVLPVMILLYGWFRKRTPVKTFIFPGIAWVVIIFGYALIRQQVAGGTTTVTLAAQLGSMIKNLPALLPFLGKIFFPVNLSVFPILADMTVSLVLGLAAILIISTLILLSRPKQWFSYFFGMAWFCAFLLPSFVTLNNHIPNFSEHRSYLPMFGILFIMMASGPVVKIDFSKRLPWMILAGICLLFGLLTFLHTRHFKDQFTFWQNAADTSPTHAFNYNNLGAMYFLQNDYHSAEPLFRKALEINPYEPMANSNTGLVCMRTNRPAEAEKYYLEEIRINPTYDHAYFNLGLLYFNHNRQELGIAMWEKTLTVNPVYADAFKALMFAYEKAGRKEEYARIANKAREAGITP